MPATPPPATTTRRGWVVMRRTLRPDRGGAIRTGRCIGCGKPRTRATGGAVDRPRRSGRHPTAMRSPSRGRRHPHGGDVSGRHPGPARQSTRRAARGHREEWRGPGRRHRAGQRRRPFRASRGAGVRGRASRRRADPGRWPRPRASWPVRLRRSGARRRRPGRPRPPRGRARDPRPCGPRCGAGIRAGLPASRARRHPLDDDEEPEPRPRAAGDARGDPGDTLGLAPTVDRGADHAEMRTLVAVGVTPGGDGDRARCGADDPVGRRSHARASPCGASIRPRSPRPPPPSPPRAALARETSPPSRRNRTSGTSSIARRASSSARSAPLRQLSSTAASAVTFAVGG